MKRTFCIPLLLLFLFISCSTRSKAEQSHQLDEDQLGQTELDVTKPSSYEANTSLILLDKNEYKTYSDHWAYLSDDEYFSTNQKGKIHIDDTISIGMFNNDEQCGLVDSLRLDKEWLSINFSESDSINTYVLSRAITKSYSYNDVIDFVPITILVFLENQSEELCGTDLAFRGNYKKSDFSLSHKSQLSEKELGEAISVLRNKIKDVNAIPPRPMASDTLLLQEMYKLENNIVVAEYNATQYSDSDSDYGNQTVFVLKDNEVVYWFGGMDIYSVSFELKGSRYLYVSENTYATNRITLLKLSNKVTPIYTKVLFFD